MYDLELDVSKLKGFADKMEKLGNIDGPRALKEATNQIRIALLTDVRRRTKIGKYGYFEHKLTKSGKQSKTKKWVAGRGTKYGWQSGKVGGKLKSGWSSLSAKRIKGSSSWVAQVYNPVEYAPYYEYGHRQTVGRFVPAFYGVGAKLVKSYVAGKFPLAFATANINKQIPGIVDRTLTNFMKGIK